MMCQFHSKIFIVRPVSAVKPSSVTENLRGRYHTISGYDSGIGRSLTLHHDPLNRQKENNFLPLKLCALIYLISIHIL